MHQWGHNGRLVTYLCVVTCAFSVLSNTSFSVLQADYLVHHSFICTSACRLPLSDYWYQNPSCAYFGTKS